MSLEKDLERIRADFKILDSGIIYLDNSATSLTPEPVIQKMLEYYHECRANVHRGVHRLSQLASQLYEQARVRVGKFIKAKPAEIFFTKNTTEAINLVALALEWEKRDEIITTLLEHNSNLLPWIRISKRYGVKLQVVSPNEEGLLDPAEFEKLIGKRTKLVTVSHVSNVLGSIAPVREIGRIAKEAGALFCVDGAQSVPHMPTNVKELRCDFLAFSGHKMCGPLGIGVLFMRKELAEQIEPPLLGGGTTKKISLAELEYEPVRLPERWEAGTPNIAGAIGLSAAVEYLEEIGMKKIERWEQELTKIAIRLKDINNVKLYGPTDPRKKVAVFSFNISGADPQDVAGMLDELAKIAVRSGHHCAIPLMQDVLKRPEGTVRASFYFYNTKEEARRLIEVVEEISKGLV